MSKERDDGGPAFPQSWRTQTNDGTGGMKLRDYFAAKAIPFAVGVEEHSPTYGTAGSYRGIAARAYLLADAMIAERNKP